MTTCPFSMIKSETSSRISCQTLAITSLPSLTCNPSVESGFSQRQPSQPTKPGSTFRQKDFGVVDMRLRTSTSGCSTHASSYCPESLARIYRRHEAEKIRQYGKRVREIEKGSFTPLLVFSATGGAGPLATVYLK